ncbi:MAG: hypothetical protein IJF75_06500 [Clostridia bacterium]|nr:hypothetical protein [Clostridia bacterium]
MYEKIKVSVPKSIYELLNKDAEDFRILKPNGKPNLNAFINSLIMNFYEDFSADDQELIDKINKALFGVPEKYAKTAFDGIIKAISSREKGGLDGEKSVAISFKPTKVSESVVVHIENVLLKNESLSSYYRRMFIAYAKKTKTEREKIIHKQNYELLCRAIKKEVQVCLSLESGDVFNEMSLYSITPAKDELFNYVLYYGDLKNKTVRLSKIKTVSLLAKKSEIPSKNAEMFARQVRFGAQYPIYSTDDQPIKVQLTEKGKDLFKRIYLYRPIPTEIDGDVYTFECSANQVIYYFERFGSEALILSPKRIGKFMRNYYYFALKKYRSIYGRD